MPSRFGNIEIFNTNELRTQIKKGGIIIRKALIKERNRVREICDRIGKEQKKYADLPSLKVSKSHGNYQYHSGDHYISKKKSTYLSSLAQKEYYSDLLPNLKSYLRKCDEMIALLDNGILDTAYLGLCEGKRILLEDAIGLPVFAQIKAFEAETYDYDELNHEKTAEIYTSKGELVRSKSEKIIADELYRRGIPYHYEKPLALNDWGKSVILHPDFTVMNVARGNIIYLEHLGLMDQPEYCKNVARKLSLYERNGLLLGRDILLLHESNSEPLNIRTLNEYIDEYFCD